MDKNKLQLNLTSEELKVLCGRKRPISLWEKLH